MNQVQETVGTGKREQRLSKDGQWRSFAKVPHLLQYVNNGNYYARIKVNGKVIRESLKTAVWTTAKLRLTHFVKERLEARTNIEPPRFIETVDLFKRELDSNPAIKQSSKKYRMWCLRKIERSWPKLWEMRLDAISPLSCQEWASNLQKEIASHYYNNTIATLRQVLQSGIKLHRSNGGGVMENPAAELKRLRVKQKELKLPEPSHFKALVENLRKNSGGWGPRVADLVEFLAYSGLRIHSEAIWVGWDDVDWQRKEFVVRGHPDGGTKNSETRRVPILPNMETLLSRLRTDCGGICEGRILQVSHCNEALTRACKEVGVSRLTHHDLRHLFATRCIESGVDIPTVSRWLGHKDGGALAMRTYGHLRNEHSQAMAQKVKF